MLRDSLRSADVVEMCVAVDDLVARARCADAVRGRGPR